MQEQTENPRIWMQRGDTQWTPLDGCPMVRCCVHYPDAGHCDEPATWGEISWLDEGGYRLTAYCDHHWDIKTNTPPPVYDIRINGREYHIPARTLDYRNIVALAWGEAAANGSRRYTVVYSNGPAHNREGSLLPDERYVVLGDGMDFEAVVTGRA